MRNLRTVQLTIGLMLCAALPALAQRIDSTSLAQLRPQRFVRIETPALGRVQGTVLRSSDGELLLANGVQHAVAVESIQRAWVRGRHTKAGAIIGGVLGAGGGVFLGLLAQAFCEGGDCNNHSYVIPGALFGTVVGAGFGAIVGSAFPRWKELQ